MCCGIFGQGVQRALSLDLSPCGGEKPHFIVVRFILRRGQTNVEIEIREFDGGVRATGLLCLLGVGVGLCTFLAYKLCSRLHLRYFSTSSSLSSSSVDKSSSFLLSRVSPPTPKDFDAGISLGIKRVRESGILQRSQLYHANQQPHVWKMRIIDWLAKSNFSPNGEDLECEVIDEFLERNCKEANGPKKATPNDPMMGSMQSGWSSGFVSNPDNMELSCNSMLPGDSREWQRYVNDERTNGVEEEDEEGEAEEKEGGSVVYSKNPRNDFEDIVLPSGSDKCKRPKSGLSSVSTTSSSNNNNNNQRGILQRGIRRNCYSFASQKSGDSSLYDYRESLISKGFSVDLGENLDSVVLPGAEDFGSCDGLSAVGREREQGAVNHMDWLQCELAKIQMDIDCLNQKFGDLCQPPKSEGKEEEESQRPTEEQHQIFEDFVTDNVENVYPDDSHSHRHHHQQQQQPAAAAATDSDRSADQSHQGTPDGEMFDFIWDYHSDLAAVEQPAFVSSRPGGGGGGGDGKRPTSNGVDVFEGFHFLEENNSYGGVSRRFARDGDDEDDDVEGAAIDDDDGELRNGEFQSDDVLGRRESVVLFYFDDDINDNNIFGDFESLSSHVSSKNHASLDNLSLSGLAATSRNASGDHGQLKSISNLSGTQKRRDKGKRLSQPIFPRNLKKSRNEQSNVGDNSAASCIEKIFSSEERKIVGDEKKLFEHLECDLNVDVVQISNIRKGYSKIFEMWGSSNVRSFRSERYSILGPITFQVLLQGIPILSDIGGNFQNSVQHLVAAIDNGHQYLMDWRYKGFLWAPKNEVLFKLINSLRIFCEQVSVTRGMSKGKCREQYLASLLNHSSDMEVHLVEALKVVVMLRVIAASKASQHQNRNNSRNNNNSKKNKNKSNNNSCLEELYGPRYSTPECVFRNLINAVEDWTVLDDIQLTLLSFTLGVDLEVISPCSWGTEGFVKSYPMKTTTADTHGLSPSPQPTMRGQDAMSIIEDDPAFLYCMPALPSDG